GSHSAGASCTDTRNRAAAALRTGQCWMPLDSIPHPFDINPGDLFDGKLSDSRTQMMFNAASIGFQGRGLFMARTFRKVQIDQLTEGGRRPFGSALFGRITASRYIAEQLRGLPA